MSTPAFDEIRVGDVVPELVRTIELPDMIAYAGATWDWQRLHYDAEFIAAAKLPGPVIDGQLFGALLAETVQDWLGPAAFLQTLTFRFANLAFAGDTIRCSGHVTSVDDNVITVALQVDVIGDNARLTAGPASAALVPWARKSGRS